jgi:outer membrane protein assembly factor BamB
VPNLEVRPTVLLLLAVGTLGIVGIAGEGATSAVPFGGSLHPSLAPAALPACGGTNWPTYLGSASRDGNGRGETSLSVSSAPHLARLWTYATGTDVSASPSIVNGVVYVGSWNGYEYALNASTGALLWKTFLGLDSFGGHPRGIASSATVLGGTVYVGGGNSSWYALNASTGSIRWNVTVGNTGVGYYNWASPLVADGYAYVGLSAKGSAQAVRGGLLQVSLSSHAVVRSFYTTARGTLGASIWTSPALAAASNTVFVTTGDPGPNGSTYGNSVLAFNASTLHLTGNWTIPSNQTIVDGDFGATPIVFAPPNGPPLVVASDKNGFVYAWNQSHLASGPVWERSLAFASVLNAGPNLGPVSWSAGRVYVGTSATRIGGQNFTGSVNALDASTGKILWQRGETAGEVLGSAVYADGILAVGAGPLFQVLNASSGGVLFAFNTTKGNLQGPPAIAHGEIVVGASDGRVYAFDRGTCRPGGSAPILPNPAGTLGRTNSAVALGVRADRPSRVRLPVD